MLIWRGGRTHPGWYEEPFDEPLQGLESADPSRHDAVVEPPILVDRHSEVLADQEELRLLLDLGCVGCLQPRPGTGVPGSEARKGDVLLCGGRQGGEVDVAAVHEFVRNLLAAAADNLVPYGHRFRVAPDSSQEAREQVDMDCASGVAAAQIDVASTPRYWPNRLAFDLAEIPSSVLQICDALVP